MGEWILFNAVNTVGNYQGMHLAAGYTLGAFTPYISFAGLYHVGEHFNTGMFAATEHDATLDAALTSMRATMTGVDGYANKSISLGMRWDLRKNMDIKVQYDHIWTPDSQSTGSFAVYALPFKNEMNLYCYA